MGTCGCILSCLALNGTTSRGADSSGTCLIPRNPRAWLPGGCTPCWAMRRSYNGLTGGEILLAHGHRDGRKDRCGLSSGPVLFSLVVPPLQPGAMRLYPVQAALFPSHFVTPKKRGSGVDRKFDFLNRCSDGRSETADAKISSKRGRFTIHMLDSEVGWITYE
jgi:hypothetical protein